MKKGLILTIMLVNVLALSFTQTAFTVNNVAGWIEAVNGVRNGGNNKEYAITVTGTVSIPASTEPTFGSVSGITVTIQGNGALSPSANGNLLNIGTGQTIIVKDLTLKGRNGNNATLVNISGVSMFRMEGKASVSGNTGRGVFVEGGTFVMQDSASVSDNTGRGVSVRGTFTMNGNALVSGNRGGGVRGDEGTTFTMSGNSSVSGNTGAGVDISGTFTMQDSASVSGNAGIIAVLAHGTFTMQDNASVSGNIHGVHAFGTFTMQGSASVSGNKEIGVYVNGGNFTMQDSASVLGNTSCGVCVNSGKFTMYGGVISGNVSDIGSGVVVSGGTFTMQGGVISGNRANYYGGGVYVSGGTFSTQGGVISGNSAALYGGGVYVYSDSNRNGTFNKTGGIIHGDDAEQKLKNTVISGMGHAVYESINGGWRNASAGLTMNSDAYGFWLNEGDFFTFPSNNFSGTRKRSNFSNTLTVSRNAMKSSSSDYVWILQSASGDRYTFKRADAANTMSLTIRLDWGSLVISGDSGNGENNWNGTWNLQR